MNHELIETYLDRIGIFQAVHESDEALIHGLLAEVDADAGLDSTGRAFLRGYMGYHFQDVLTQVDCEAEFRDVLTHDPDHHLANLYLGYQTFDTGNYATALGLFQNIALDKHFLWSQIKIRELIVCCHLHLKQFVIAETLLFPVLRQLAEAENEDCALPTELLNALVEWHAEFRDTIGEDAYHRDIKRLNDVLEKLELAHLLQQQLVQIYPKMPGTISKEGK